jgi:hypothetical protein
VYKLVVQVVDPVVVEQTIVEFTPEGALGRVDDVQLHVAQERLGLLVLELGQVEAEELLGIEAADDGAGQVLDLGRIREEEGEDGIGLTWASSTLGWEGFSVALVFPFAFGFGCALAFPLF